MNCPICCVDLVLHDYFGRIATHQDGKVIGDIWHCPNGRKEDGSCESETYLMVLDRFTPAEILAIYMKGTHVEYYNVKNKKHDTL